MEAAEKISVTMTPEMLREIRASVAAGEYASTSEALRDAVRLWQRSREEQAERIAAIKARVRRSIEDPRPSLSVEEMRGQLAELGKATGAPRSGAA